LGLKVPLVEDVLTRFTSSRWYLELKQDSAPAAKALCTLLKRIGAEERVLVASFQDGSLLAFREACPKVATSMTVSEMRRFYILSRTGLGKFMSTPAVAIQLPEVHQDQRLLTPSLLKSAQARGYRVQIWTVNKPEDMERLAEMKVDALFTDRVDLAMDMRGYRRQGELSPCDFGSDNIGDMSDHCARAWIDENLRLNHIQTVGTHNSYKQAISAREMALIVAQKPGLAKSLDYAHKPIPEQLDLGMRQLELDLYHDPDGGRFADPMGPRIIASMGQEPHPFDASDLRGPGLKVFHVQDIDYRSSCLTFKSCLTLIRDWSLAHANHAPILILLNTKDAPIPLEGAVVPLVFDAAALDGIDAEIRSVFDARHIIRPDEVQRGAPTLRDGVRSGSWPLMKDARGRVLFALIGSQEHAELYGYGRPSLEDRMSFIDAPASSPAAAYMTIDDPVVSASKILSVVQQGFIVRTRADADTLEARTDNYERQTAAFLSGAQYVSTDYPVPDPRFGEYQTRLDGGGIAHCNPAITGDACGDWVVE
jgi:hypothetical protein